jgi:mono/diheme cytochrome c family protein
MVELLGCGVCHTDGALVGAPDTDRLLAGSRTGIAYTSPLEYRDPGVVFPPNITPDEETGIGRRSDEQILLAIRAGLSTHVGRPIALMPWQGYAALSDDDANAIVAYLRSIKPIRHRVPAEVHPGSKGTEPFVYFGVYAERDNSQE